MGRQYRDQLGAPQPGASGRRGAAGVATGLPGRSLDPGSAPELVSRPWSSSRGGAALWRKLASVAFPLAFGACNFVPASPTGVETSLVAGEACPDLAGGSCGDGVLDPGEDWDDGNTASGDGCS